MKSMLHEASTVMKAIEKAWVDSGKPLEFTVNILEVGEKNFFGLTKRPAIISITYEPKKQTVKGAGQKDTPASRAPKQPPVRGKDDRRVEAKPVRREALPQERMRAPLGQPQQQPVKQRSLSDDVREPAHEDFWESAWVDDAQGWFKDVIANLGLDVPFTIKADKRVLNVVFERAILPTVEDERQLFASFSYLVVQFLKKKHKKKLRGFHLVISSKKNAPTPDKPKSPSSY